MRLILIIIVSLFFQNQPLSAQTDFSRIDEHADKASKNLKQSIPAMVNYLVRTSPNDLYKVRAIFRWITQNIRYDIDALYDHSLIVDDPEIVFKRRKSVCGGYSELFKRMCEEAGITAKVIIGWSKGYSQALGNNPNHAWNAVRINHKWYLLDVTWGAGYIDDDQSFHKSFQEHYFLTEPENFIYDHYPMDENWQMLEKPISLKEFDGLIMLRPAFFKTGLKIKSNHAPQIKVQDYLVLKLEAPRTTYISVKLLKNEKEQPEHCCLIQRQNTMYSITTRFPGRGNYILRVFSKTGKNTKQFDWACDFNIKASNYNTGGLYFVKQFGKFFDLESYIHEPTTFYLSKNNIQNFEIEVKYAKEVSVIVGETFFTLKKTGKDTFTGKAYLKEGPVLLVAKTDNSNKFHWLLEYKAQ